MAVNLAKAPITHYVLVFETDRVCGGAEEGGWWYNTGEMEYYYECTSEEEAQKLAKELREGEFKGKGNLYSVNHRVGDTFEVWVSDKIVTHFPEHTPRYE